MWVSSSRGTDWLGLLNERVQLELGSFKEYVIYAGIIERTKQGNDMRCGFIFCNRHKWMSSIKRHDERS